MQASFNIRSLIAAVACAVVSVAQAGGPDAQTARRIQNAPGHAAARQVQRPAPKLAQGCDITKRRATGRTGVRHASGHGKPHKRGTPTGGGQGRKRG